jgi:hypothetical protein
MGMTQWDDLNRRKFFLKANIKGGNAPLLVAIPKTFLNGSLQECE